MVDLARLGTDLSSGWALTKRVGALGCSVLVDVRGLGGLSWDEAAPDGIVVDGPAADGPVVERPGADVPAPAVVPVADRRASQRRGKAGSATVSPSVVGPVNCGFTPGRLAGDGGDWAGDGRRAALRRGTPGGNGTPADNLTGSRRLSADGRAVDRFPAVVRIVAIVDRSAVDTNIVDSTVDRFTNERVNLRIVDGNNSALYLALTNGLAV